MDCPVYRTIDFTKSSGGEKTMIWYFWGGALFGGIIGYSVATILSMVRKDGEVDNGNDN